MKNQFTLVGNVGQKPELKTSKSGKSYLQFSIAVNDDYKAKDATEWTKRPAIWFNLVVFDKRAEALAKVLDKGKRVTVTGKLKMKTIEQNGKEIKVPELEVFQVQEMASSSKESTSSANDPFENPEY